MEDNGIIMSVGIAIRKKDKIILGCDKQQSTGDYKCLIDDKMICNDDFIVLLVGRIREIQIFKNKIFPLLNLENFSREYIESDFVDELFKTFKSKNIIEKDNKEYYLPINLIIASKKGDCYKIGNDGTVNSLENFLCIGGVEHEAEAILMYCIEAKMFDNFSIEKAIKAISKINSTVSNESLAKIIDINCDSE